MNNLDRYMNNNNNTDFTLWDVSKININISNAHKIKFNDKIDFQLNE